MSVCLVFFCCFLGHGNVRNETNNQQNWQNYTAPIHAQHTQLYKSVQLSREIQYLLVRKNMWEICIGWEWDDRWKSYTNHTLDLFIRMKWGKKRRRRDVSLVSNQMIMSLRIWIGEKTNSNTEKWYLALEYRTCNFNLAGISKHSECERFNRKKIIYNCMWLHISQKEPQNSTNTLALKKPYWHTRTRSLGCTTIPNTFCNPLKRLSIIGLFHRSDSFIDNITSGVAYRCSIRA